VMMLSRFLPAALSLVVLSSCVNKNTTASTGPHATVFLRDGSTFSGTVTATSPQQITVAGDDKQTTRTIDMKDVKTVDYGDQPVPAAPPAQPTPEQAAVETQQHAEQHYHPEESAIQTRTHVVPAGADIAVRTEDTIDSGRAVEGQTYPAEVARNVLDAEGQVVIARGSNALIVIRSAAKGGHFRGTSDLVLDLESLSVEGRRYELSTADVVEQGKAGIGKNRRTAEYTGGGALVGTIIGAIAGHGKGAAIGGVSGGAAGAAGQLITRGGAIHLPPETLLTFRLDQPLRVSAR